MYANEFSLSEFHAIRELFFKLTGSRIAEDKQSLVESRLTKRVRELNLTTGEYVKCVFKDSREREILISLLTTHKTDWFREYEHFIFLKSALKEGLIDTHGKPLIVWSAAASTGEEAYSLAMFLSEIGHSFRILGTDISEDCLRKAKAGAYAKTTVDEQVELSLKKKYFLKGTGVNAGLYRIAPILAHPMKWRKYNLVDSAGLSSDLKFDIIFLRNALIYFDRESTQSIIHNVIKNLNKGGYLIIGLSETIYEPAALNLKRVASSVYLK